MNINIELNGNIVTITPTGEIDLNNSPELRKALLETVKAHNKDMIINLSNVSYMDSSGLATLVEVFQHLSRSSKRLALASLSTAVRNIFSITRLEEIFHIYSSVSDAIKDMSK